MPKQEQDKSIERYLNIVKRGYKDCGLDKKYFKKGLNSKLSTLIINSLLLIIFYINSL